MFLAIAQFPEGAAALALIGGLILLYISVRALLDALAGADSVAPGRAAVACWIPIAAIAVMCVLMGRPELAVGVTFATSVAAISLASGSVSALSPPLTAPPAAQRIWPFVLPAALLALLAGFSAQLNLLHASVLGIEGLVLLGLWRAPVHLEGGNGIALAAAASPPHVSPRQTLQLLLGLMLAGLGSWLAARGTIHLAAQLRAFSGGVAVAVILGPGLTLPMVGAGAALAGRGRSAEAMTTHVGVVLLNLCALLPLLIVLGYIVPGLRAYLGSWCLTGIAPPSLIEGVWDSAQPLPYPMGVWRVDTVVLIVLGLLLVPPAAQWWPLGRREGMALIIGYAAYLMLVIALAARV